MKPYRLLWISIIVAILTIVLKTLAWRLTGSISLLSDALESFVNLAGAVFALWMVTLAQQPPDKNHPFGHSKAEYFSSGFEGLLIIGAALAMIVVSVQQLFEPKALQQLNWGLALSVVSSALNGCLAWMMFHSARKYRSIALEADARHLMMDVWTSVGVILGLIGVLLTDWLWLDSLVALGVALNILREGSHLFWRSVQGLMDEAVDDELLIQIKECLNRSLFDYLNANNLNDFNAFDSFDALENQQNHLKTEVLRFDHLRSRRSGQRLFVDLHLHVPGDWSLSKAAALRGNIEQTLMTNWPDLQASIQLLPADVETHIEMQTQNLSK